MKKVRLLALAAASSLLFALSLPNEVFPYGFPPLGPLALVPLYFAMLEAPSYRFVALAAGLYGALHHCLSSYWLFFFHDFAFWTLGTTTLAYFLVYAVYGLYMGYVLKHAGHFRPIAFALFWTCLEYAKSTGFLGYPWGLLPYTQTLVLPFLQAADITGVYGLGFVLALANAAVAELLFAMFGGTHRRTLASSSWTAPRVGAKARGKAKAPPRKLRVMGEGLPLPASLRLGEVMRQGAFALGLVGLVLGYGFWKLANPVEVAARIKTVIVQQNADPWATGETQGLLTNIRLAREAMAGRTDKPDLILFSESTLQRPYLDFLPWFERQPASDPLGPFIRSTGAYLFTGAPIVLDWQKFLATNSVILIAPDGRQVGDYAKVHPVPFSEAIPFWDYKPFREFIQKVVGLESGWEMGTKFTVFELPSAAGSIRFGAPICFEDAFPEVCRQFFLGGADLLVNLTNDSWSKTDSSEIQHFAAARFRAIEFRKTLVRSTNGGVSCVVGADGRVLASLPLFKEASMMVDVPVQKSPSPTIYLLWGDWFAKACLLLFSACFLILWGSGMRRRRKMP
jgi:apolipoprotein N-acyltransferase